jgi:hypothetical protein
MTGGSKAGIAFAVLLVIGGIAFAGFFIWRKKQAKKNAAYKKDFDEKHNVRNNEDLAMPPPPPVEAQRSPSLRTLDTPRLEVRPESRFNPLFPSANQSAGAPVGGAAALQMQRSPAPQAAPAVGPVQPSPVNDPANPFGNHAETSDHLAAGMTAAAAAAGPPPRPITRFPSDANKPDAGVPRAAGDMSQAPRDVEQPANRPGHLSPNPAAQQAPAPAPSPTASDYGSMSSGPGSPVKATMAGGAAMAAGGAAAAAAAAGGPNGPSAVHRVQLDFKPSMDDELGLQAGQLVRLLHEYDDGWVSRNPTQSYFQCPRH